MAAAFACRSAHGELTMNDAVSRRQVLRAGVALGALMLAPQARACEFFGLHLRVTHPWTRVAPAGAPFAMVCMRIDEVTANDRLIGVETAVATGAEIGGMSTGQGLSLPIERGQELIMTEFGVHVRLLGLKQDLLMGRTYDMRLLFEKSGVIDAQLSVDYEA